MNDFDSRGPEDESVMGWRWWVWLMRGLIIAIVLVGMIAQVFLARRQREANGVVKQACVGPGEECVPRVGRATIGPVSTEIDGHTAQVSHSFYVVLPADAGSWECHAVP